MACTGGNGDNDAMEIMLNGDNLTVAEGITIAALIKDRGLGGRRVAVEVNGEIVPRGSHAERALAPDDKVEIVHALGGG